jgi:hypothetical protein
MGRFAGKDIELRSQGPVVGRGRIMKRLVGSRGRVSLKRKMR